MSARKSERLLNLLILLLVQRGYVTKERIREVLYADETDEAFERKFDRDKEELRSIGVPIELGSHDAYFDDEPGYRIRPDRFALPEISLSADEAAVVGLATKVWEHARLSEAAAGAVEKLRLAGLDLDPAALELVEPRLTADEPAFDAFLDAARERAPLRFRYRGGTSAEAVERHVRPWGLVRSSGRWYAVCHDLDRGAERVFRLSRVVGEVTRDGPVGSYEVPEGIDLRAIVEAFVPARVPEPATVLLRPGAGPVLRRRSTVPPVSVPGPDGEAWDRVVLPESGAATAEDVLALGADALVEAPESLRASVVDRLGRAVEGAR